MTHARTRARRSRGGEEIRSLRELNQLLEVTGFASSVRLVGVEAPSGHPILADESGDTVLTVPLPCKRQYATELLVACFID